MKKIILIVIVLAILVIILTLMNKNSDRIPTETGEKTAETATTTAKAETDAPSIVTIEGVKLADGSYGVDKTNAKLSWTGKKTLLKNWIDKGLIDMKEAVFEVKDGAIVSNRFIIDMTSIRVLSTGKNSYQDTLSKHLKSADFFDAGQFPVSVFTAKSFASTTDAKTDKITNTFLVKGDLTIKGITNEITIPASFAYTDSNTISIKGSANVDRTLWDARYGSDNFFDNLGDNVIDDIFKLDFELQLKLNRN